MKNCLRHFSKEAIGCFVDVNFEVIRLEMKFTIKPEIIEIVIGKRMSFMQLYLFYILGYSSSL